MASGYAVRVCQICQATAPERFHYLVGENFESTPNSLERTEIWLPLWYNRLFKPVMPEKRSN